MLITIIPLLLAIIGLLIWALTSNPKLAEVGRCLMWCGVLVTLFGVSHTTVRLP